MRNLYAGELIVRSSMSKEASAASIAGDVAQRVGNFARGTGRVIQDTSGALGQSLEREVGGNIGAGLRTAAEAAPTVGAVGLGALGLESALGHPVENWLARRRQAIGQKLQGGQPSVYNPSTGVWY